MNHSSIAHGRRRPSGFGSALLALTAVYCAAPVAFAADAYGDNHQQAQAWPFAAEGCLGNGEATVEAGQTDWYQIDVMAGQQRNQFTLSGRRQLLLELLDADGLPVMGSNDDLDAGEFAIDQETAAGRYYLTVSAPGVQASSSYQLCWQTQAATGPRDDSREPDNDSAAASDIRRIPGIWISSQPAGFGRLLDNDGFRVAVGADDWGIQVLLRKSGYESQPRLQLFDADGNAAASSDDLDNNSRQYLGLQAALPAGDYYLRVEARPQAVTYDLCWTTSEAEPDCQSPAPSESSGTATADGTANGPTAAGGAGGSSWLLLLLGVLLPARRRAARRQR